MTRIPLFFLATAALVSCSSNPTGPAAGSGTFVLRSVAGEALPSRIITGGFGGSYLADTLWFEPRTLASFGQPTVERATVVQQPGGELAPTVEFIAYQRLGDIFHFLYPCPPGQGTDCAIGFVRGTLAGDQLEITLQAPFRSPLLYERVPPQ